MKRTEGILELIERKWFSLFMIPPLLQGKMFGGIEATVSK